MKRSLIYIVIVLLLTTPLIYFPTIAWSGGEKCSAEVTVTVCETTNDGEVTTVAIYEIPASKNCSQWAMAKSSLRAGVAVGKAIFKTATVVANSVGRAARHATVALIESAIALT
jgi:hypothetical protein